MHPDSRTCARKQSWILKRSFFLQCRNTFPNSVGTCFCVCDTHRRRIYRTAVCCTSPGITTRTRRRWKTRRRTPILPRRRRPSRRTQTGSVRGLWTERRGSTPSHAPPSLWPSSSSTSSTGSPTRSSDTRAPQNLTQPFNSWPALYGRFPTNDGFIRAFLWMESSLFSSCWPQQHKTQYWGFMKMISLNTSMSRLYFTHINGNITQ